MQLNLANKDRVLQLLNEILEIEMAGVVRYTHYSLMIIGHARIPITKWMQDQAQESLTHAQRAGEMVTHFEEHPSLSIGDLLETYQHDIDSIMSESLEHEKNSLNHYYQLLEEVKDQSVILEEYAREMIAAEETHIGEVEKMMRKTPT
jgi:bacterioferritin